MFSSNARNISFGLALFASAALHAQNKDWPIWGGTADNTKFSPLKQISAKNVGRLKEAWRFDSGDAGPGTEIQCNPLVIDGILYGTSPKAKLFALNAATGAKLWEFDPTGGKGDTSKYRNRGLNVWQDPQQPKRRILFYGWRQWLQAVDATTGTLVPGFGQNGRVDLRQGLGRDPESLSVILTTPGVVFKDLLIIGSLVPEGLPSAPGFIRAYDVRTGEMRWAFKTIPAPGEPGYETWPKDAWTYTGGTNSWAGLVLDEKRGIVFAPTGSASFDFYGSNRHGDNLYANCLLALNAADGKKLWHYQFVKHDVWDRDLPAAPTLVTVTRNGRKIDAVSQTTKNGFVYVFDRETGQSLFPLRKFAVPDSDVPGERLAREQELPTLPPPFARQEVTEAELTKRTPAGAELALQRFRSLRSGPQFTPPTSKGTFVFPGFDGGAEWGGSTYDAKRNWLFVNANEMAWVLRVIPKPASAGALDAVRLYARSCSGCHREDRKGSPPEFPAVDNLAAKMSREDVARIIATGQGRMPGFGYLKAEQQTALVNFLLEGKNEMVMQDKTLNPMDLPYTTDGYNKFLDPDGYPALAPPWGTFTAIDLNTGKFVWRIPFGEYPELASQGLKNTGSENYGGSVLTATDLLFIGATNYDKKFRAIDSLTGKVLWETTLPYAGNATPATFMVNGKQYVVIAAGGGKSSAAPGATYVAFALP